MTDHRAHHDHDRPTGPDPIADALDALAQRDRAHVSQRMLCRIADATYAGAAPGASGDDVSGVSEQLELLAAEDRGAFASRDADALMRRITAGDARDADAPATAGRIAPSHSHSAWFALPMRLAAAILIGSASVGTALWMMTGDGERASPKLTDAQVRTLNEKFAQLFPGEDAGTRSGSIGAAGARLPSVKDYFASTEQLRVDATESVLSPDFWGDADWAIDGTGAF